MVEPDEAVPVVVLVDGEWWPGFVKAWRGERVYVEYTKGPGSRHLHWMPADKVKRVTEFTQEPEQRPAVALRPSVRGSGRSAGPHRLVAAPGTGGTSGAASDPSTPDVRP